MATVLNSPPVTPTSRPSRRSSASIFSGIPPSATRSYRNRVIIGRCEVALPTTKTIVIRVCCSSWRRLDCASLLAKVPRPSIDREVAQEGRSGQAAPASSGAAAQRAPVASSSPERAASFHRRRDWNRRQGHQRVRQTAAYLRRAAPRAPAAQEHQAARQRPAARPAPAAAKPPEASPEQAARQQQAVRPARVASSERAAKKKKKIIGTGGIGRAPAARQELAARPARRGLDPARDSARVRRPSHPRRTPAPSERERPVRRWPGNNHELGVRKLRRASNVQRERNRRETA